MHHTEDILAVVGRWNEELSTLDPLDKAVELWELNVKDMFPETGRKPRKPFATCMKPYGRVARGGNMCFWTSKNDPRGGVA